MPRRSQRRHRAPEVPSLRALGERVRAARTAAGLSQAVLGAPHFTRAYVSAVELGKIRPSMAALAFLSGRLGREPAALLEDAGTRSRAMERELALLRARELLATGRGSEAVALLRHADGDEASRLLARALVAAGEPRAAISLLDEAVRRASDEPAAQADAHRELAAAHRALGDRRTALDHAATAVRVARTASGDPLLLARALGTRASIELEMGQVSRAVGTLEQALEACGPLDDAHALAELHSAAAGTAARAGEAESAVRSLRRAVTLFESTRDLALVAELRAALAVARSGPPRPSRRSAAEASS